MITSNVYRTDGLVNSVRGQPKRFDPDPQKPKRIPLLWIVFDNHRISRKMQAAYAQLVGEIRKCGEPIDNDWTPVKFQKKLVFKTKVKAVKYFLKR